jgi:thioredoxin reductase (NADPH)
LEYDVIIIGAGPAGISSSIYSARANLKTLVLYKDISSIEKAQKIENYYGFEKGIDGNKLYQTGLKQAKNLGVEIKKQEVIKIEKEKDIFHIYTTDFIYNSKSIVLATGNKKNSPQITGIDKFEGRGVSYCATCDGFFYKNSDVAVLGDSNYAISETNDLLNIAKKITILTNGKKAPEFRADNVSIDTRKVKQIRGKTKVEEVEFEDGDTLPTNGIFIAQGVAGSTEFAKKLGAIVKNDKIVVDQNMQTNIKGLYACGDCTRRNITSVKGSI